MKLHIENIMAIGSADIDLDGITVIVGNNNTGKSTAGKVLWAMFRALSNLEAQMHGALVIECMLVLRRHFMRHPVLRAKCHDYAQQLVNGDETVKGLIAKLQKEYSDSNSLSKYVLDWISIQNQLQEILAIDEDELQKQVVLSQFNDTLGEQIVPLFKTHGIPSAQLTIKGKTLRIAFNRKLPKIEIQLDLQNKAYYFDNPSLLDSLVPSSSDHLFTSQMSRFADSFVDKGGIIEDLLQRKKYETAEAEIVKLLNGKVFYETKSETFKFKDSKYTDSLELRNLSQGAKSIATLQVAFSRGAIKERDVIILDEPEIHLHPEWQIKFAELIVLLQKEFNLTVLLTSHSPDFVEAIRLYAEKYGSAAKLNGYVSRLKDDTQSSGVK